MPAGVTNLNGVQVYRFPVDHSVRDAARYERLHSRLIRHETLPLDEQYEWIQHGVHSPALYAELERRQAEFDVVIFVPYLFGTTYYGSLLTPNRAVLWPCLHDEIYAYLAPTRDLFHACRGIMFNTIPERELAQRLYGQHPGGCLVGFGMEPIAGNAERFRMTHNLTDPFVLYSGRVESGKNVPLLVKYFVEYKRRQGGSLKLVLMGEGPALIPVRPDIVRLGFQRGEAKHDVYAAATVLCQPSINESFSIVIMEAWLCAVPVLVHTDCAVTHDHVTRSDGGLYFRSYDEFEATVDLLVANSVIAHRLGENGLRYVRSNCNWGTVLQRFEAALRHWRGQLA
jgi:glycosyltransferase involved in cell wall biosynthesis